MLSADSNSVTRQLIEIRPSRRLLNLELGSVWRYRELLCFLIWRDLKIRYKQAAIGVGWAIIQPLFAVLIFTAVFGYFAHIPSDGLPYPVFAYAGLLPWTYFSEAFRRAGTGLVDDSELIRKIYFPRLIIPLAMVVAPMVDLFASLLILLPFLAWYGIFPTANIVFLPIFLFLAMILALALGLWLGPTNVRFRDVKHTIPFLIQIWMYASPVVYPLSIVPERLRLLYSLNPMVGVIQGFRWALFGKDTPDFHALGLGMTLIVLASLGGLVYFKKMERFFADVI